MNDLPLGDSMFSFGFMCQMVPNFSTSRDGQQTFDSLTNGSGPSMRFDPAATAMSTSPFLNADTAWCKATKLDEQAVSMVAEGPLQSKKYDIRLAKIEAAVPVAWY